jgi:NitT/TauT family transport system permease protein
MTAPATGTHRPFAVSAARPPARRASRAGILVQLLVPVIALLLWQAAVGGIIAGFHPLDPVLVGRPDRVAAELARLVRSGQLPAHLGATLTEAILGLTLAIVTGVTVGIAAASNRALAGVALPYVNIANAIPKLALGPLFLIWFGIGLSSKVAVSAATAFFPLFYTTYQGVQGTDRELLHAMRIMGAGRWALLRLVTLPSVLTWLVAGLRTSLGLAIVGAVVGEYLGSTKGLGYLLLAAQGMLNTDRAWAILVVLGAIGVALDGLARFLEHRLLRWRMGEGP